MSTHSALRAEPSPEVLEGVRRWLAPVRGALGPEFLAAYLTGSVLTSGWSSRRSAVNLLVVARALDTEKLTALAAAVPSPSKDVRIEPLFVTRRQMEHSLDVFAIEWTEIHERHLLLEGEDVVGPLRVPPSALRAQLEHELRSKHLRLRHAYLLSHAAAPDLERELKSMASSFSAIFRTLLRLRGEIVPAEPAQVIARVADLYRIDVQGLLGAHLMRHAEKSWKADQVLSTYRAFLSGIDRLIEAIDELRVP
jgi:hypothetical protein